MCQVTNMAFVPSFHTQFLELFACTNIVFLHTSQCECILHTDTLKYEVYSTGEYDLGCLTVKDFRHNLKGSLFLNNTEVQQQTEISRNH